MPLSGVVKAFEDGVGGVLGFIAIVVALGTMLGKMMAESGGAARIATTLIALFGEPRVHWAIMVVAFIVGIPVFFQVGFMLLIPLVFTIARRSGLSLVKIGIPLVGAVGGPWDGPAASGGDARGRRLPRGHRADDRLCYSGRAADGGIG